MDYREAEQTLRGRESRKVGNNTYLQRRSETVIALRLHKTDVLTFHADGRTVYDSGGWRTVTTKQRMNAYGPLRVGSNRGTWYLGEHAYAEGITVHADGTVTGQDDDPQAEQKERKRIARFCKLYMDALERGEVKAPGPGDCWGCLVVSKDGRHMLEGDGSEGAKDPHHHIRLHLGGSEEQPEPYFVPSLLANALKELGAAPVMWWWVGSFWDAEVSEEKRQSARKWGERKRCEKQLRRYILRKLGHAR